MWPFLISALTGSYIEWPAHAPNGFSIVTIPPMGDAPIGAVPVHGKRLTGERNPAGSCRKTWLPAATVIMSR